MFLSGAWVRDHGAPIITPFKKERIDCSAYTMRIGGEAYISPEDGRTNVSHILQLNHREPITIPPGQFAFLITREFIYLPHDLFALINIKSGLKVQGLVNVSGFHVDPGYKGNLVFAVFNAGPKTILLREGDDAFLIWFARLEQPSEEYARKKKGFTCISSELASNIPRESASLNSLNKRIDKLNTTLTYMKWGLGAAATIALGAAGKLLADWLSHGWKG